MDFALTEEQKMLKAMVRDFAEKELEPVAAQVDEESRYPAENVKKMAELGLMGVPFPEKYGGSGGGEVSFVLVEEELSRVCASTGTVYFVTAGLAGQPIYMFSNEEQRQRWVPDIAAGRKITAFGLDRGRRRQRSGGHGDHGDPHQGRLHPQRHQDIHHQRRRGRPGRRFCHAGQIAQTPGHHRLRGGKRHAGFFRGQARAQAGHTRLLDDGA